jgi:prolipoprotein diacylglyceryltransferase
MVPVEVRAFGLLTVCVILLAAVLIVQWIPARATVVAKPLMLLILALVIALGILVAVTTSQ